MMISFIIGSLWLIFIWKIWTLFRDQPVEESVRFPKEIWNWQGGFRSDCGDTPFCIGYLDKGILANGEWSTAVFFKLWFEEGTKTYWGSFLHMGHHMIVRSLTDDYNEILLDARSKVGSDLKFVEGTREVGRFLMTQELLR